jgi:G:T-mismatch repair DNA endonuclease (very short patch repair protein)
MRPFSEEHKAKISAALRGKVKPRGEHSPMFGKHHSAATRAKISAALRGNAKLSEGIKLAWKNPEYRTKQIERITIMSKDPLYRAKVSAGLKGRHLSEEHKAKLSAVTRSEEARAKMSVAAKNRYYTEETRAKLSASHRGEKNAMFGKTHTAEARAKISLARRQRVGWHHSPETIRKIMKYAKPNKVERKLINILDTNWPNRWKFVGNGQVVLGGLCPDFINCNGKKQIIELFGDYWHNRDNMPWYQTELGKMMAFSQYGYKTLVIWEHELKDEDKVISKIKQFSKGKTNG